MNIEFEADLLGRLLGMQADGCWILVERSSLRSGQEYVRIAEAEQSGRTYPVVFSGPRIEVDIDPDLESAHVSLEWLAEQLGRDCLVLLDPGELPGVRLALAAVLETILG